MTRLGDATRREIAQLATETASHRELGAATHTLVSRVLPYDFGVWCSLDPASMLPTMHVPRVPESMMSRVAASLPLGLGRGRLADRAKRTLHHELSKQFMRHELGWDDSLSFWNLGQAKGRAITLDAATGGDIARSPRAANAPPTVTLRDELRVLLTDANEAWGVLVLARTQERFTDDEVELARTLGPLLGAAARHTFLRAALQCAELLDDPPGLILLDARGRVQHHSPEVERLVGSPDVGTGWSWLSTLLGAEAEGSRLIVQADAGPVTAHASSLGGTSAVIVERCRPATLADLLVRAYGLTPRERDIVQGLSQGWSTRRIAFELDLADTTVQDHLKSVFAKVGVRSRREVVSALFFEHYVPKQREQAAPSPFGWYLPGDE